MEYFDMTDITKQAIGYLGLRIKGSINEKEISCHCPFHVDKTPSMFIDSSKGIYHCFSCGKGGSIRSLFRDILGQDLYKTLGINTDRFSNYANVPIDYSYLDNFSDTPKEIDIKVNGKIIPFRESVECIKYIRKRGIPLTIADSMNFGYAEDVYINNTPFRNRLIIPIIENGKLISVEGRRLNNNDDERKVLYPKNSSVNSLYDLDNLDKNEDVYACEGLMDLAVLRSCNLFKNSTSIFGANLTKKQISLIGEFKRFIYCPDSDRAGDFTVETLKNSGLSNVYILKLPPSINNVDIKDIGDIPKTGVTIDNLVKRKWLSYITKI